MCSADKSNDLSNRALLTGGGRATKLRHVVFLVYVGPTSLILEARV